MKRLPRLLLVLTEFPPRIGGMQTHAMYLSRHLASRGYPLEVLTYQPTKPEEKGVEDLVDRHLPFRVHRALSRLSFWASVDRIISHAKRFKPDLIYCSTVFYGFVKDAIDVPILCRSVGNDVMRPWIAYPFRIGAHTLAPAHLERHLYDLYEKLECPEWIERIARDQRRALMQTSARKMDLVMANSQFTAGLLREVGLPDDRIQIVVGGVETKRFEAPTASKARIRENLGIRPDQFVMTTACRLVAKKGIDFLLRAFAEVRRDMKDAHLMIIGGGPHDRRSRLLAQQLGLDGSVTFTGRVPHDDIPHYMWASDAFVLASRVHVNRISGQRDAETMGRVLCEANAAGIPVLASRSGGIPSVVYHGENGLLFESDDAESFATQVHALRDDAARTQQMIATGKRWARERFDWSVIVNTHEEAFNKALN